tara:strand:+ start:1410 stop:1871 length:462 start_codon:yes stop_codon:yes gene_type:complete
MPGFFAKIKRFGEKAGKEVDKGLRLGQKAAESVGRFGDKVSKVASTAHTYTGAAASALAGVPVLGAAAGLADKGAMLGMAAGAGLSAAGKTASGAIGAGQAIVRTGRGIAEGKSPGEVAASLRDMKREAGNIKSAGSSLVSQGMAAKSKLQRP